MKLENLLTIGVVGVVGYLILQAMGGLKKGTDQASDTLAAWWLALFPNPPAMQVLGSVVFPDGSVVALSRLQPPKADASGAVFVQYNGHYYQLSPSDQNGNWPATLVG